MNRRGGFLAIAGLVLAVAFPPEAGAISRQVNCGGGATYASIQAAVDDSCSNDTLSVAGSTPCAEAVNIQNQNAGCSGGAVPFTKLTITGNSNARVNAPTGPAFTIQGNCRNITINSFQVTSPDAAGIVVQSAHRVTLQAIKTSTTAFAAGDGINIDTNSTRTRVLSSTLIGNGDDGVEMGAAYGEVQSVTASDNENVGINITGANVFATRDKTEDTSAGNTQEEGLRCAGSNATVQQCTAKDNQVAQFRDVAGSTGTIHYRNTAGASNATAVPAGLGVGFLEEGTGNKINTCTATKNAGRGIALVGNGNALQATVSSQNLGSQLEVLGDGNFVQLNTLTRVSTVPFNSVDPAVNVPAGADSNFFDRNRVSLPSDTAKCDGMAPNCQGFRVIEPTNNGTQNTVAPSDPDDPPAALR